MPYDLKRSVAHKLSKSTGLKSGKIFQGAKKFVNGTGKFSKSLGPAGIALSVGVGAYEIGTDTWDAHTFVNGGLLLVTGAAFIPIVGPVISIGLGVADSYGAFDDIYNYFE